jgi:hypothetical protein
LQVRRDILERVPDMFQIVQQMRLIRSDLAQLDARVTGWH